LQTKLTKKEDQNLQWYWPNLPPASGKMVRRLLQMPYELRRLHCLRNMLAAFTATNMPGGRFASSPYAHLFTRAEIRLLVSIRMALPATHASPRDTQKVASKLRLVKKLLCMPEREAVFEALTGRPFDQESFG
jgi:hypothetical protein